jgi:glycosyltransferase involved in cell wall biosynthesis
MQNISLLITAYNVERYIGRAIRSALDQSIPRDAYEIIVINDCSSDRTRFALEVFEEEPYDGPLKKLDNVILTPHIGSYAMEARIRMEEMAVENLLKALG